MEFCLGPLANEIHKKTARSLTMKKNIRIAALVLMTCLIFMPWQAAAAKGNSFDGQVIFGQAFTLKQGETLNGDLLIFGGSATLEEGATVNGDVVLFGGSLTENGEVIGDVAVTGGSVFVGAAAHIHGNLSAIGATLDRVGGAQIDGKIYNTATSWIENGVNGSNPVAPVTPTAPIIPNVHVNINPFLSILNAFGQALGMAILAMLVMLFLAPHAYRVAHAVIVQPLTAGGLGLLTVIAAPITLVLMAITLILIPVVPVVVVALFVAGVFGWIAIGYEIGQRMVAAIHQDWHPAFSAGLGVFILTIVARALTGIPVLNCIGWLLPFLLILAGLGAVIMTRFGTQTVLAPAVVHTALPTPAAPVELNEPASPASPVPPVASPEPGSAAPHEKPRSKKE
jgi:hypothetical protein